jgi:sugar lactone lactonase YvrE
MRQIDVDTAHVSTVAGVYGSGSNTDGANPGAGRLNQPRGIGIHPFSRDRFFVSDFTGSCALRVVRVTGSVETVAGDHTTCSKVDGVGSEARFHKHFGVQRSPDGKALYVDDYENNVLRRVDPHTFVVTTVAGNGGTTITTNADPLAAGMNKLRTVAVDHEGVRLYVGMHHAVAAIRLNDDCAPRIVTLRGGGEEASADFALMLSVTYGAADDAWYTAPRDRGRVDRSTDGGATWAPWVGSGIVGTFTPGTGTSAVFNNVRAIAMSIDGSTMFVADSSDHKVGQITVATAELTLIAGSGAAAHADGIGAAASFSAPSGVTQDFLSLELLVADKDNHRVRTIAIPQAMVLTVAGTGTLGNADNADPRAGTLDRPYGIAVHPRTRDRFVVGGNNIRRFSVDGNLVRVAGAPHPRAAAPPPRARATATTSARQRCSTVRTTPSSIKATRSGRCSSPIPITTASAASTC